MNSDSWDERRKAQEEEFFHKENERAMARLKKRAEEEKPRLSPITGEPMIQKTVMGVVIDQCEQSQGIWLDCGELEEVIKASQGLESDKENWLHHFFSQIFSSKI